MQESFESHPHHEMAARGQMDVPLEEQPDGIVLFPECRQQVDHGQAERGQCLLEALGGGVTNQVAAGGTCRITEATIVGGVNLKAGRHQDNGRAGALRGGRIGDPPHSLARVLKARGDLLGRVSQITGQRPLRPRRGEPRVELIGAESTMLDRTRRRVHVTAASRVETAGGPSAANHDALSYASIASLPTKLTTRTTSGSNPEITCL